MVIVFVLFAVVIGRPGHEDGIKGDDQNDDDVDPFDADGISPDCGLGRVDVAEDEFVGLVIDGEGEGNQSEDHQRLQHRFEVPRHRFPKRNVFGQEQHVKNRGQDRRKDGDQGIDI